MIVWLFYIKSGVKSLFDLVKTRRGAFFADI